MIRYPDYKNSGINLVGEVPSHWSLKRADGILTYQKETVTTDEMAGREVLHYSIPSIQEFGEAQIEDGDSIASNKLRVTGGEILVSKLNPRKGTVTIVEGNHPFMVCSSEFIPLVPTGCDQRFAYYLYTSETTRLRLSSLVESATKSHQRANPTDIYKMWNAFPPLEEQRQLASYLDRKTGEIDVLIENKQALIALLHEQRTALIHRAVTKGLNPEARMKDSGIEWLGEVPAHWDLVRIKSVIESSQNGIWGDDPQGNGDDIVCLRVADFDMNTLGVSEKKLTMRNVAERYLEGRLLSDGDLLIEKSGGGEKQIVGRVVRYDLGQPAVCSNFVARITPRHEVADTDFLLYYFQVLYAGRINYRSVKQTTGIQNLDAASYFDERISLPPLDEQQRIGRHIAEQSDRIEGLIVNETRLIRKLRELRASLISGVVTGKIDVRASVPAETLEPSALSEAFDI